MLSQAGREKRSYFSKRAFVRTAKGRFASDLLKLAGGYNIPMMYIVFTFIVQVAIKKINETTFDADARTRIDDLNSDYGLRLPEDEDYDTLGGFVFSHLGYIPKAGEEFDYENIKFTITAAESRNIKRVKIQKLPTQQAAE